MPSDVASRTPAMVAELGATRPSDGLPHSGSSYVPPRLRFTSDAMRCTLASHAITFRLPFSVTPPHRPS